MSVETIYGQLIAAGMTPAGACGLMGNMDAESEMRSNNAQNGMTPLSDEEYTLRVDAGTYSGFADDRVGYGLCQWTLPSRKRKLLAYAKEQGVSIGDEYMQVQFAIRELKNEAEYSRVYACLSATDSVYTSADMVCRYYERPAVNNVDYRASKGLAYYKQLSETTPIVATPTAKWFAEVATLCKGFDGSQVELLRLLLLARGYDVSRKGLWESSFDEIFKQYQRDAKLEADGYCGPKTWRVLIDGTDSKSLSGLLTDD